MDPIDQESQFLKPLINLENDSPVVLIYSIFYNILFETANYYIPYAYIYMYIYSIDYRFCFLSAFSAVKIQYFSPIVI